MLDLPRIRTTRLLLREMRASDAEGYAALLTDPDEAHFITDQNLLPSEVPARIQHNRRAHAEGRAGYWSIEQAGEFVGFAALHAPASDAPALSYAVSRRERRRGVASEALGAVIRHGFEVLRVPRLTATTHLDNAASANLLLRLGFREVGRVTTASGERRAFELGAPAVGAGKRPS